MPVKPAADPRFIPPGPDSTTRAVALYPELLGLVLRHHRDMARLRQADLADELGWPQPKISRIERGDAQLAVSQLDAMVTVLNRHLHQAGEDSINPWNVLARADRFAHDLIELDYAVTWCIGPEWNGSYSLLRGDQLKAALALAHVPFST